MDKLNNSLLLSNLIVLVRGAGEIGSGIGHRLVCAKLRVIFTENEYPLAVRRTVSFCEAVYNDSWIVEGLTARYITNINQVARVWKSGEIPLLIDPNLNCLATLTPAVIIDATLAKIDTGLRTYMAPLTIALGPGFCAPEMVHVVIETNRGHNLGRLIYNGRALADTGIPANVAGYSHQRVLRAPCSGVFKTKLTLGIKVQAGQVIGNVDKQKVYATIDGLIRGLLFSGTKINCGFKLGDIDPNGRSECLNTISDKVRTISGSVLEAIMTRFNYEKRE